MIIAKVVGNVVATKKDQHFAGEKILIVQAADSKGGCVGDHMLAFDADDAGIGDYVLVTAEGGAAKQILGVDENSPVDVCIAGIMDDIRQTAMRAEKH